MFAKDCFVTYGHDEGIKGATATAVAIYMFGIIDGFDTKKDYGDSYEPKRYHCIVICDDALDQSNILKH